MKVNTQIEAMVRILYRFKKKIVSNYFTPVFIDNERNEMTAPVFVGGQKHYVTSNIGCTYLNSMKGNQFELNTVKLLNSLITKDHYILDVGANIGITSILFGKKGKRVYSFEPSPSTFNFLQKNIQAAKLENVETFNLGLGNTNEVFDLAVDPNFRAGAFIPSAIKATKHHIIEKAHIAQGDYFIHENKVPKIDFIKIDVEGFEQQVIEGMVKTLNNYKPLVVLELNHWCLQAFQRKLVADFFDFLKSVFPILYAVDRDAKNLHDPDSSFYVMHEHIVHSRYFNIVGAFSEKQLERFYKTFSH